jgi:hypothetical protein
MKISFGLVGSVPYNMDLVFKAFAVLFTMLGACGRLNEKFIITIFFFSLYVPWK